MPHYTLKTLPERHLFHITLTFSHHTPDPIYLDLPNWVLGSYMIREFARHITQIQAQCNGQTLALRQTSKNQWQIDPAPSGDYRIDYRIYAFDLSVRGCYLDTRRVFFDGAALFLRLQNQANETHQLTLKLPTDWDYATSLPQTAPHQHQAANYRQFTDHPLEAGHLKVLHFQANGIPHRLVISGHNGEFDEARLTRDTQAICESQLTFFPHPAPFEHYTFLLHLGDKLYGGLEHQSSTALLADRNWLPHPHRANTDDYSQLLGLISHEYFHAWNVKSIQPTAFASSDQQHEAYTEQLWAFEGITSYYDDLFLVRSGTLSPEGYLKNLTQLINRVHQSHGHTQQTLAQSSFTAWDKYYKPNENSPNANTSYYQKGALAALCLDLHLRRETAGQISLDTIMRQLYLDWTQTRRPLAEGEWEQRAIQISGLPLTPIFDHFIRSTEILPLKTLLPSAGLELQWLAAQPTDFGARFQQNSHDIVLSHVATDSSAEQAGLAAGDRIIAINGECAQQFALQFALLEPEQSVTIHYFRHGILHQTQLTAQIAPATQAQLNIIDRTLLQQWLQAAC